MGSSFPGQRCSPYTEGTLKLSCMCAETCRLRSLHHTSRRARIRRSAYTFLARRQRSVPARARRTRSGTLQPRSLRKRCRSLESFRHN